MKVLTELKDVVRISEFSNGILLGYNKDGLCTLIRKYNFSFIYPGIWFKSWEKYTSKYYLVELEDGNKTLIYKSNGSFVNEELKFKKWTTFPWIYWIDYDEKFIVVERDDGLTTLLRFNDLSFLCKDKWAKQWYPLDKEYIIMVLENNKSTLISPIDGSYIYNNIWYYDVWKSFTKDYYLVSIDEESKKTLIKKSDGSLVYNEFWVYNLYDFGDRYLAFRNKNNKDYGEFISKEDFSVIDKELKVSSVNCLTDSDYILKLIYFYNSNKFLIATYNHKEETYKLINSDLYDYVINYNQFLLFRKSNKNLYTLVFEDGDVVIDNFIDIEHFDDNVYLITMQNDLSSLFDTKTKKYVYDNAWFKKWNLFSNQKLYRVTREDGLQTLIYKKDASFVFDDLWFEKWYTSRYGYYEVFIGKKKNYVKADDGTLLFKEFIPQDQIIESDKYNNKIFVLEDEKIYMYEL